MGNALSASGDGDADELPTRAVTVGALHMARFEVTKALWDQVRAWGLANGYTDLPAGGGKATTHPVHSISWYAMVKWCNARSQKEGLTPCYYTNTLKTAASIYKTGSVDLANTMVNWTANGYRLPTEAEWERAARGGLAGKRFAWGDTIIHAQANYFSSASLTYDTSATRGYHPDHDTAPAPYTSPVGSFAANAYGLHDIAGNLQEWCWDRHATYAVGAQTNPPGPATGANRVLRGGAWNGTARAARAADRVASPPSGVANSIGFRPVRVVAP